MFDYSGPVEPFARSSGPRSGAKIALVGEAFGEQEDIVKRPFIGSSGQELRRMLRECGIDYNSCFATNVFNFRPPSNNLDYLCGSKSDVGGKAYTKEHLKQGKYIHPRFFGELERLEAELSAVRPNLTIALGATACWAITGSGRIGALRGTTCELSGSGPSGAKVLATYHPSAVMRNWAYRPIVLADFMKAKREAEFPEIRRPQRFVLVNPTLAEIDEWRLKHAQDCRLLSIDIETRRKMITMIGFATSRSQAIVIPFMDSRFKRYWPTLADEVNAWRGVQAFLTLDVPKLFQNGLYDMQYILGMSLRLTRVEEDAMLLHHSMYPELQKGLGFMGSIYTQEPAWKLMRGKSEELKADE